MNFKLKKIFEQFVPFMILGIVIALGIGLLIFFSYLLLWGLLIGALLWVILFVKHLFSSKPASKKSRGRIIEHEDQKKE